MTIRETGAILGQRSGPNTAGIKTRHDRVGVPVPGVDASNSSDELEVERDTHNFTTP